ncbi:hypothetical protein [uncultured Paracoccus sp.]|uniref:hypothetical protein n=1 Tax=uncultured Paracoccus sp. TaxID=189685 RepID=UPI0025FB4527|nr:hypothetical protein [uncultured Paracoccus sp.]
MLNDLLILKRGLAAHDIKAPGRHPDIKGMAKGSALRVRLAAGGRIDTVEIIQDASGGFVWTLRDGQHNGFPGLKTAAGLLLMNQNALDVHNAAWKGGKSPVAHRQELQRLLAEYSARASQIKEWPSAGHRARIAERLVSLQSLRNDPLSAAVPAAFERFLAALDALPSFLEQLVDILSAYARSNRGDEWNDLIRAALTGPVALAIDVEELEFQRDATDPRQVSAVSRVLNGAAADRSNDAIICALSGHPVTPHAGNFPQPTLPGLGQTYLFSRNSDIPSLARYGRTADASFPIGAELVQRLSGAVETLTDRKMKDRTWRLIPAEAGDKPDLLVVSLADPELRPAEALASDDEVSGQAALKELASRVIAQSKGKLEHGAPEDEVTILVLRAVDPANRKSIYHHSLSASGFWHAAQRWQGAVANTPEWMSLPFPGKGKSEIVIRHPPYVSPLSLVPLSRAVFANGGRRRIDVTGVSAAEMFQLFLDRGDVPRLARKLLAVLIKRHGGLLSGLAQAQKKGSDHLKNFDPKADLRRDALRSATWIGVLLLGIGRKKEGYMLDAGFRMGQLLATVDAVHVGYCMDVRKGSIPSSLIGNSLLGMASERPQAALKLLLKRWPPYAHWASSTKPVRNGEKDEDRGKAIAVNTALSHARRIAPVAAALCEQLRQIDGKTSEAFQAELLLGYMAGLPPREKKSESTVLGGNDMSKGEEA